MTSTFFALAVKWGGRGAWTIGSPLRANRRFLLREQALLSEESSKSDAAQAGAAEPQEIAAIKQPPARVREV